MVQTRIGDVSAEIIEWVHDQPYWVQLAVKNMCESRNQGRFGDDKIPYLSC